MAELVSDEGIVLRRRAFAEADRILVFFTRDQGKISVLARGARRAKARNAAGLDLLTRSELLLVPGRTMSVLAQARAVGLPWPGADIVRTACGAVLAELVDATVEEGHPDPALYQLVSAARERMASSAEDARLELALASFQLAAGGGYLPDLHRCAMCGEVLEDREGGFLPALGGIVQGGCWTAQPGVMPCAAATLRILRRMESGDVPLLRRLRWPEALRDEVESILLAHLEHHLDRPLKAARILADLRGLAAPRV
ncbi:MAG TPA: DNA repair protein RecO [Candidatus Dormibacteraeota bacterium]|nr:DNA repair protein RecO [Candidatus Dormibacteraeota bacterium]